MRNVPFCSKSVKELESRLAMGELTVNSPVRFYFSDGAKNTTVGRVIIWSITGYFTDEDLNKKSSKKMVTWMNRNYTPEQVIKRMKKLQDFGNHTATMSGLSVCIGDCKFDFGVDFKALQHEINELPYEERIERADTIINECTARWFEEVDPNNPFIIMGKSGARVSPPQVRSMMIAKGLQVGMDGSISPHPVLENLANGLSPINYFRTAGPARRGLADNFFIVPATGYAARQLVNCNRDLYVVEHDCCTEKTISLEAVRCRGRVTEDGQLVDQDFIDVMVEMHGEEVKLDIRSVITCESDKGGVCQVCAGLDPATNDWFMMKFGLGVASAEHLSEKLTQSGLRGKHLSGAITLAEAQSGISNQLPNLLRTFGLIGTRDAPASHGDVPQVPDILAACDGNVLDAALEVCDQAYRIYNQIGFDPAYVHLEITVRAMTDQVVMPGGQIGLRSSGDVGDLQMHKASQVPKKHPSWLRSIGYGHVKGRLIKAVENSEVSYGVPAENLMAGLKII